MAQDSAFRDIRRGDSFYDHITVWDSPESSTCASLDRSISFSSNALRNKASSSRSGAALLLSLTGDDRPATSSSILSGRNAMLARHARGASGSGPHTPHGESLMGHAAPTSTQHRLGRISVGGTGKVVDLVPIDSNLDAWSLLFPSCAAAKRYLERHNVPCDFLTCTEGNSASDSTEGLARVHSRGDLRSVASSLLDRFTATSAQAVTPLGPLPSSWMPLCCDKDDEGWPGATTDVKKEQSRDTSFTSSSVRPTGVPLAGIRTHSTSHARASVPGDAVCLSSVTGSEAGAAASTKRPRAVRLPESPTCDHHRPSQHSALLSCAPTAIRASPLLHSPIITAAAAVPGASLSTAKRWSAFRSVMPELLLPPSCLAEGCPPVCTASPARLQQRASPSSILRTRTATITTTVNTANTSTATAAQHATRDGGLLSSHVGSTVAPSSPSSTSSFGAGASGAVLFLGEYPLRQILGSPSLAKNDTEAIWRSFGSLSSGDSHRASRTVKLSFHSSPEEASALRSGRPDPVHASLRSHNSAHDRLFRVESDGTLMEESAAHDDTDTVSFRDGEGEEGEEADKVSGTATPLPQVVVGPQRHRRRRSGSQKKTGSFRSRCHSQRATNQISASRHSSFLGTSASTMGLKTHRKAVLSSGTVASLVSDPAAPTSPLSEPGCAAAAALDTHTGLTSTTTTTTQGDAGNARMRHPSTGFKTFSAEWLVFGGAAGHAAQQHQTWRDQEEVGDEEGHEEGHDGERSTGARGSHHHHNHQLCETCTASASASAVVAASTAERIKLMNQRVLERTLHSTLGLIPATGLADGADSDVLTGVDMRSGYLLPSTMTASESTLPPCQGDVRRQRSFLSLTATAAQSQTWFGASPLRNSRAITQLPHDMPSLHLSAGDAEKGDAFLLPGSTTATADASERAQRLIEVLQATSPLESDGDGEGQRWAEEETSHEGGSRTLHALGQAIKMYRPSALMGEKSPNNPEASTPPWPGSVLPHGASLTSCSRSSTTQRTPGTQPQRPPLMRMSPLTSYEASQTAETPPRHNMCPFGTANASYSSAAALWATSPNASTSTAAKDRTNSTASAAVPLVRRGGSSRLGRVVPPPLLYDADTPASIHSSLLSALTHTTDLHCRNSLSADPEETQRESACSHTKATSTTDSMPCLSVTASRGQRDGAEGISSTDFSWTTSPSAHGAREGSSTTPTGSDAHSHAHTPRSHLSRANSTRGAGPSVLVPSPLRHGEGHANNPMESPSKDTAKEEKEKDRHVACGDASEGRDEADTHRSIRLDHPLAQFTDTEGGDERRSPARAMPRVLKRTHVGESWRPRERVDPLGLGATAGGLSPRSSWGRSLASATSSATSAERPRSVIIIEDADSSHSNIGGSGRGGHTSRGAAAAMRESRSTHEFPPFSVSVTSNASQTSSSPPLVHITYE